MNYINFDDNEQIDLFLWKKSSNDTLIFCINKKMTRQRQNLLLCNKLLYKITNIGGSLDAKFSLPSQWHWIMSICMGWHTWFYWSKLLKVVQLCWYCTWSTIIIWSKGHSYAVEMKHDIPFEVNAICRIVGIPVIIGSTILGEHDLFSVDVFIDPLF